MSTSIMSIVKVNEIFSVSGAITEEDMRRFKEEGVGTLICTRFDGEEEHQVLVEDNISLASKYGLKHFFIPVKSGLYDETEIQAFAAALAQEAGKVHGYCRTGTRAAHLWALSQQNTALAIAEIEQAGINVAAIKQK